MKHKAFTEIVAHSCRVPKKTVALFARNLKEAGLLTTGARGVNAPEMTVLDLTRMVIALCATDRPSEATGLTNRYCIATCSEDVTIHVEGREIAIAHAGDSLEGLLSGILAAPTVVLFALAPDFSIHWNSLTADLRVKGVTIEFRAPALETDEDTRRGISTIRGIGEADLLEMALPFFLEKSDGTSWESMVSEGRTQAATSEHVFGTKREDGVDG